MDEQSLILKSLSHDIEKAFKSLMHSGRPDIMDGNKKSIIKDLYVDLFGDDYILRQVIDSDHIILKGRRGTGKSTIFVRAEEILIEENKGCLPIYINLQTCYEQTPNKKTDDVFSRLNTYKAFLKQVIFCIKENIENNWSEDSEFQFLFNEIDNGKYVENEFERMIEVAKNKKNLDEKKLGAEVGIKKISMLAKKGVSDTDDINMKYSSKEIKVYDIHGILLQLKRILRKYNISNVFLFLDDFSELDIENQKVIVDALIAPIISSYNDTFKVKIAAYPNRIYMGNIDSTKIPIVPLDFYEAFGQTNTNYKGIEKESIEYIRKTLNKRLDVFTKGQISLDGIFNITTENTLDSYLKKLFEVTAAIPRCLGFILNYCYLSSINKGTPISMTNIDNAAIKYYEENLYPDFINDIRFKQSFHDDKKLLDQISQKCLINGIVKYLFNVKRNIIKKYQSNDLENKLFLETMETYKKGNNYWLPTSHFYIDKDKEQLLNTLELYFMVHKFNEGSKRGGTEGKVYYYGLNYGLCLQKKIDYGRPEGRRSADYWRQDEFDLTSIIPQILSSIETIQCSECNKIYSEMEYEIYKQNKNCFKCTKHDTVRKINKFEVKLEGRIAEWKQKSLPNIAINILRVLYNNQPQKMSAYEIGQIIDQHHMSIYHATKKLDRKGYIGVEVKDKRYYYIKDKAINEFFGDDMEEIMVE
ncbi:MULTISPECIES: hypothetical protein [Clostridium]|uniref:hypothetical protein n=1 Tax=Clostridium TaxID=1485 RepID=UPI00082453BA|nr:MULTISPECIES: hypothetical protein [Clostridium]PJI07384.1 hypothetical protein CUB90_05705 [Clostridium sp. CT7]